MEHHKKGFTLIELMAVIVILGILTTIVVINVSPFLQRANFEKIRADLAQVEKALETYRFQHYSYPTTEQGIEALFVAPKDIKNPNLYPPDGYLSSVPQDPWGSEYLYLFPGQYSKYDVFTYGADGTVGGEGDNADVGNWQNK
jgi:general secretion pathway protein G